MHTDTSPISYFSTNGDAQKVSWYHAANSRVLLSEAIAGAYMMIEADVNVRWSVYKYTYLLLYVYYVNAKYKRLILFALTDCNCRIIFIDSIYSTLIITTQIKGPFIGDCLRLLIIKLLQHYVGLVL